MNFRKTTLEVGDLVNIIDPICELEKYNTGKIVEIKQAAKETWFLVEYSKTNPIQTWCSKRIVRYTTNKK